LIFATVGSQMPFDRLVRAVDAWAGEQRQPVDVLAQIGQSAYAAHHIRTVANLTPAEFRRACSAADVIVAHAGMGSVLTALELGRTIVLLPRRADLQETRNDHQQATACWLGERAGVWVAADECGVGACIDRALAQRTQPAVIEPQAAAPLLDALDRFLRGEAP
jgi:UDP-N-acetylglucosamine transferase subunit ALG13